MIAALAQDLPAGFQGVSPFLWVVLTMVVLPLLRKRLQRWVDNTVVDALCRSLKRLWRLLVDEVLLRESNPGSSSRRRRLAAHLASWFRKRLRRVPGITEAKLTVIDTNENIDTNDNKMGARLVVVVALNLWWAAYTAARKKDHTLQVGMWLRLAGLATVALGCQALGEGQPWARHDLAVGVSLLLVGHYLGALRPPRGLVLGLPVLGPLLVGLAARFEGPVGSVGTVTEQCILVGAFAATLAGTILFLDIASVQRSPDGAPEEILLGPHQRRGIVVGMWCCRLACWSFGAANVLQAATFAPTIVMKGTHVIIAILLSLAAGETFRKPDEYLRLVRGV